VRPSEEGSDATARRLCGHLQPIVDSVAHSATVPTETVYDGTSLVGQLLECSYRTSSGLGFVIDRAWNNAEHTLQEDTPLAFDSASCRDTFSVTGSSCYSVAPDTKLATLSWQMRSGALLITALDPTQSPTHAESAALLRAGVDLEQPAVPGRSESSGRPPTGRDVIARGGATIVATDALCSGNAPNERISLVEMRATADGFLAKYESDTPLVGYARPHSLADISQFTTTPGILATFAIRNTGTSALDAADQSYCSLTETFDPALYPCPEAGRSVDGQCVYQNSSTPTLCYRHGELHEIGCTIQPGETALTTVFLSLPAEPKTLAGHVRIYLGYPDCENGPCMFEKDGRSAQLTVS
jgi:hypothetical protein